MFPEHYLEFSSNIFSFNIAPNTMYATQFQMSLSEHLIKNDDAKKLELQILFCRESSLLQHE